LFPMADSQKRKRWFDKDLKGMMYGFGDDSRPYPETIALMEDLVLDFITEVTEKSMAAATKKGRLHEKDLQWAIRKDRKKYARVKELLYMQEELKKARKGFEEAEMMRE